MDNQQKHASEEPQAPNFLTGLAALAKNVFGLLFSRVELASLEMAEVRTTVLKLALVFALGIVATWFALAYWTALVVVLTWDSLGWKILLIIASVFSLMTLAIVLYVRALLKNGKLSLAATMTELRKDRDALL